MKNKFAVVLLSLLMVSNSHSALDFTGGQGDLVDVGNWSVVSTQMTIAVWVYLDSENVSRDDRYVSKAQGTGVGDHVWMIGQSASGLFRARVNNPATTCFSNTNPVSGRWYHVGFTYDNGSVLMYVDGIENTQSGPCSQGTGALPSTTDLVYLGNQPTSTSNDPDGRLDDIRIYNRALTAQEFQQLYWGRGKAVVTGGLEAWYKFDEGKEGQIAAGTASVKDYSGNGRHGTPAVSPVYFASPLQHP